MMVVALKKLMKEKTNHQPPNPKESIRFSTVIYPDIVEKEENLGTQNPETSAQARLFIGAEDGGVVLCTACACA